MNEAGPILTDNQATTTTGAKMSQDAFKKPFWKHSGLGAFDGAGSDSPPLPFIFGPADYCVENSTALNASFEHQAVNSGKGLSLNLKVFGKDIKFGNSDQVDAGETQTNPPTLTLNGSYTFGIDQDIAVPIKVTAVASGEWMTGAPWSALTQATALTVGVYNPITELVDGETLKVIADEATHPVTVGLGPNNGSLVLPDFGGTLSYDGLSAGIILHLTLNAQYNVLIPTNVTIFHGSVAVTQLSTSTSGNLTISTASLNVVNGYSNSGTAVLGTSAVLSAGTLTNTGILD